jgi:hypothetical protein
MQLMLLNIVQSINFLVRAADDLGTKTADRQDKMIKMEHKRPERPRPFDFASRINTPIRAAPALDP